MRAGGLAPGAEPAVAPLTEGEVESRRASSALAPLLPSITASLSPVVDDGLLVVVTDTDGRVLWRRGRTGVRRLADRLGFVQGSAWTEANVGTNAIGTCLVVGEPVHIHGPEHYVESHTRWSCAASPVLDPWTGRTLGAVDISGPAYAVQRSVLALVGVTARLAAAEVRGEHTAALERLRAYAAPVVARVGGRTLAVDPSGHIAAVTGFTAPDRLLLPPDLSPESTWLPTLAPSPWSRCPAAGWSASATSTRRRPSSSSTSAAAPSCGSAPPATPGSTTPVPGTPRSCSRWCAPPAAGPPPSSPTTSSPTRAGW